MSDSAAGNSVGLLARVGLTRRGRTLLAAAAGALVAAWATGEQDLLGVAVLLVALPAASVLVLRRTRYGLRIDRHLERRYVGVGQDCEVRLALRNVSHVPLTSLLVEEHLPAAVGGHPRFVVGWCGPGQRREVTYRLTPQRRGRYAVGPLVVRLTEPFGCAEVARRFPGTAEVIVTPAVVALPPVSLAAAVVGSGGDDLAGATGADEPDASVRGYRRGDDLRRVHWRSTARTGEMMVRRESNGTASRAAVLLDDRAGSHSLTSFEWAVTAAASIAVHLAERGFVVQLVTSRGQVGGPTPALAQLAILGELAVLAPRSERHRPRSREFPGAPVETAVTVALCGATDPAQATRLIAGARQRGPRIGLLLDVAAFDRRVPAEDATTAPAALLTRAGWRVLRAGPQTSLPLLWAQLRSPALAGRR